jgi:hypothetical protein
MLQSLYPLKQELGHAVQIFGEELVLKGQILRPDSRLTGADKPTTQRAKNSLGSSLQ